MGRYWKKYRWQSGLRLTLTTDDDDDDKHTHQQTVPIELNILNTDAVEASTINSFKSYQLNYTISQI